MTLFGYGKTTQAIAKRFGGCDIFDDKFSDISTDEHGNRFLPSHLFDPESSTLEVTSPGIAPNHPLTSSAKHLISEYDLFAESMPFSVWISGTNGKTTTTEMTQLLLKKHGSEVGGNIGEPLANLDEKANIWVLETSSFALHYTKKAKPNIYVLLPITPDHISWHGSMDEYEAAKLKPFSVMREGELIIAPKKYANVPTNGFFVGYETTEELAVYFGIELIKLRFKGVFALDAVMALAVSKALFDEVDYDIINAFQLGAHKQEEFVDIRGRLWVDDSKATNIDAAIEAVRLYADKKIFLILGGDDKGADITALFEFLHGQDVEIFSIGSNAEKIYKLCKERHLQCHLCHELSVAVLGIDTKHTTETVALLSPAAASLDQFSSYKERGEKFKLLVSTLH